MTAVRALLVAMPGEFQNYDNVIFYRCEILDFMRMSEWSAYQVIVVHGTATMVIPATLQLSNPRPLIILYLKNQGRSLRMIAGNTYLQVLKEGFDHCVLAESAEMQKLLPQFISNHMRRVSLDLAPLPPALFDTVVEGIRVAFDPQNPSSVSVDGKVISLTRVEGIVFGALVRAAGSICTKQVLQAHMGYSTKSNTVQVQISRLRGKLGPTGRILILSIHDRGYRLDI